MHTRRTLQHALNPLNPLNPGNFTSLVGNVANRILVEVVQTLKCRRLEQRHPGEGSVTLTARVYAGCPRIVRTPANGDDIIVAVERVVEIWHENFEYSN
jgi:hypothetical protein